MVISHRKCFVLLATGTMTLILVVLTNKSDYNSSDRVIYEENLPLEEIITYKPNFKTENWRGLKDEEIKKLSVLGRILFLEEKRPEVIEPNKKYQILVWKYGKTIENRHLKNFGKETVDPFADCSVKNCELTYEDSALKSADIVIFHMHRMKPGDLPPRNSTRESQIWAFLTDESPHHTFMSKNNLTNYNGVFNWSMTYRMDSDIPVPYGRTVLRKTSIKEETISKRRDILVAIMGSNCGGNNTRWNYVKELQKYIKVDTYGGCGTLKCPGHFKIDCPLIDKYLFYLAFENSNCDEYVTEKLWWNAFAKNSIPIVMGASIEGYKKLLPPGSYLNIEDYARPKDLAQYILYLNTTGKYKNYYEWKGTFEILNEHGYFQSKSYHYCRVCEALNYNQKKPKVYTDLSQFWNVQRDCHPPTWIAK